MNSLLSFATLALAALASVDAAVVPRTVRPSTYLEGYLEPYEVYHTRYLAIECHLNHGKQFFDDCCHPMLATETLEKNRKAYCVPSPAASSSAHAAEPTSTVTTPVDPLECDDEQEDTGDLEDCDEGDDASAAPAPQPTPESKPTPSPVPLPLSSKAPAPRPSPEVQAAPQSTPEVKATPSPSPKPEPKPEPTPEPKPSTTKAPAPQPTPADNGGIIGSVTNFITGGFATFFFQNGVAGACGTVNPDNALIAAMDSRRYGNTGLRSSLCGRKVNVTNTRNNKSVVVTIADACPTCENNNSIDLSRGAFEKIATFDEGMVPIKWAFV